MYSQVDEDGNSYYSLLCKVVDRKSDRTAVRKDDGFETTNDGWQWHRHDARLEAPHSNLEGRIDLMGAFKGLEGIFSGATGGIRRGKQDYRGTCFCLVGKACAMQM
jgi:hypothetical protein